MGRYIGHFRSTLFGRGHSCDFDDRQLRGWVVGQGILHYTAIPVPDIVGRVQGRSAAFSQEADHSRSAALPDTAGVFPLGREPLDSAVSSLMHYSKHQCVHFGTATCIASAAVVDSCKFAFPASISANRARCNAQFQVYLLIYYTR